MLTLSQRRFFQCIGRSIASTWKPNTRLFEVKTWSHVQQRSLHAQWTYLLDHCWIYREHNRVVGNSSLAVSAWNQFIESDESQDNPLARTILFLHDSHADKTMCEYFAEDFPRNDRFQIQCLLVNLR